MTETINHKSQLDQKGFTVLENIYTDKEVNEIISCIEITDSSKPTFRKSSDLFAIRQFIKEIPQTLSPILNENLKKVITEYFGSDFFIVKSIYFDKPEKSNWFVSYHQDLTISVDKKIELRGYGPWTVKQDQFAVQPPMNILESIFTIRIHLDDTDENNGALKIVPGSHLKSIYRPETINWNKETEESCKVKRGGIMIMRPLLLHSSSRTTNDHKRRVIHIEFSNHELSSELEWAERTDIS